MGAVDSSFRCKHSLQSISTYLHILVDIVPVLKQFINTIRCHNPAQWLVDRNPKTISILDYSVRNESECIRNAL